VNPALADALRALEQLRTVSHAANLAVVDLNESLRRMTDDLWVGPIDVSTAEEVWPRCDMEPRHPRRCAHGLTARQYRAACRRWRREHRAWRRRQPIPPVHMVAIRVEGKAVTRDRSIQKFAEVQIISRDTARSQPELVELVVQHSVNKLRAALVRHWEEA